MYLYLFYQLIKKNDWNLYEVILDSLIKRVYAIKLGSNLSSFNTGGIIYLFLIDFQ